MKTHPSSRNKRIGKWVKDFIISIIGLYLFGSFVHQELNIFKWHDRIGGFIVIPIFVIGGIWFAYVNGKDES